MKAFSLLQAFRQPDEWLTSSEMSRRARLPEASGYRLVQTLEGIGAVVRDGRGRYRPGMLLLSLSADVVARDLWSRVPQGSLDQFAREFGISVQVGVLDDDMVTHVAHAGCARPGMPSEVGMQFEAYPTAIGKVLLAALDPDSLDRFLSMELIALTSRTITDADHLRASLAQVREQGVALDDRESLDTLACLAVPIRDPHNRTVAAVSVSDAVERMTAERREHLLPALQMAAEAIGKRLYPRRSEPATMPRNTSRLAASGGGL